MKTIHIVAAIVGLCLGIAISSGLGIFLRTFLFGNALSGLFGEASYNQPPIITLNDFVKYKKTELIQLKKDENLLTEGMEIQDILIEGMDHFVGVSCLKGDDFEVLQEALYNQLKSIPEAVRIEVVNSALIKGTSVLNVVQNSSKPLQTDGRASAYLGWWSTRFTEPSHYETCVMVSGISFTAAETLTGYIEEKRTEKIGIQPCNCGFLYCEKCPLVVERIYSMPVYKRHAISLKDHALLHQYMVKTATDMATQVIQSSVKPHVLSDEPIEWNMLDNWQLKNKKEIFIGN